MNEENFPFEFFKITPEVEFSFQIEFNLYLHILSSIICALIFGFFSFEFELLNLFYGVASTVLIVLLGSIVLKVWNKRKDSANGTEMLDMCKRDYKIGYCGISMIIIGSHVALLAVEVNFRTYAYITCVAVYSITVLFLIFVRPSSYHSWISPHTNLRFHCHQFQLIYISILFFWSLCFRDDGPKGFKMGQAITCAIFVSHFLIFLNSIYAMTYLHNVFKDQVYLLSPQEVVGQLNDGNNGRVTERKMKKKKKRIVVELSESEESDGEGGGQRRMTEDEEKFSKRMSGNKFLHKFSATFFAIQFVIFAYLFELEVLNIVYYVASTISIVLLISIVLKLWNKRKDSANGTGLLDICKRDYKIGYGGISMIIIGSHVSLLAVEANFYTYAYITWVAVYSINILFRIYVLPSTYHSYISTRTDLPFHCHIFQYIYMGVSFILSLCFKKDDPLLWDRCMDFSPLFCERREEINLTHASTGALLVSHMLILFNSGYAMTFLYNVVFKDQVYLLGAQGDGQLNDGNNGRVAGKRMKKKKRIVVESSESEESDGEGGDRKRYNDLECKICFIKYSAKSKKRSPRILTTCGHTVCFKCIKNITASRKFVVCPFCKKRTNVAHGAVKKLPKNYAIIGLIEEMNEENKEIEVD